MKFAKPTSLFVLFLLLVMSEGIQAKELPQSKNVLVIGTSRIYKDDTAAARSQAITNSLFSAIENVTIDFLPFESLVQNFRVVNEILYNTEEFVRGYKVLAEALSGNTYRVIVQATISIDSIQQQLSATGIMIGKKSMPRVVFFIAEQTSENSLPQYWWGKSIPSVKTTAEISMAEMMIKNGLLIVDYDALAQNMKDETLNLETNLDQKVDDKALILETDLKQKPDKILSLGPELNYREAVKIGVKLNADIVIVGKSAARRGPNIMGKNIKSFKGNVTVRAFRTDTGDEIALTEQTSVSASADEIAGSRSAIADAGALAGKDLSLQIIEEWRKEIKEPVNIKLVVEGIGNFANFVKFRKTLTNITGVNSIQLQEMRAEEAVILTNFSGNAKELAEAIMINAFDLFGINIYEVSQRLLRIELITLKQDNHLN